MTPELAELAAQWRDLDARIDAIDIPRQQQLLNTRDQLDQSRQILTGRLERLSRQLQQETGSFPWPKRRRRIHDLQSEHDQAAGRLADVIRRLDDLDTTMIRERLPDRRQLGELFRRRDQLDIHLRRAAALRVLAHRTAPPGHLTDLLGPRPADPHTAQQWDRSATRIEHHRLRRQLTEPNDPLGHHAPNLRLRRHATTLHDEFRRRPPLRRPDPAAGRVRGTQPPCGDPSRMATRPCPVAGTVIDEIHVEVARVVFTLSESAAYAVFRRCRRPRRQRSVGSLCASSLDLRVQTGATPAPSNRTVLTFPQFSGSFHSHASVAELADALGLGPSGLHSPWGFESPRSHHLACARTSVRRTSTRPPTRCGHGVGTSHADPRLTRDRYDSMRIPWKASGS